VSVSVSLVECAITSITPLQMDYGIWGNRGSLAGGDALLRTLQRLGGGGQTPQPFVTHARGGVSDCHGGVVAPVCTMKFNRFLGEVALFGASAPPESLNTI